MPRFVLVLGSIGDACVDIIWAGFEYYLLFVSSLYLYILRNIYFNFVFGCLYICIFVYLSHKKVLVLLHIC